MADLFINSVDWAVGSIKDAPREVYCQTRDVFQGRVVCITDRGQGILSSLKRVLPDLKSANDALAISYQKVISGRAPEKRGNGLKFVRSIINSHSNRALLCMSGDGVFEFGGAIVDLKHVSLSAKEKIFPGVITIIRWKQ